MGKDFKGDAPLITKIAAGLTTGALAITIASPTDLVKVRMQAEGKLPAGVPKRYPSAVAAYRIIAKCASDPSARLSKPLPLTSLPEHTHPRVTFARACAQIYAHVWHLNAASWRHRTSQARHGFCRPTRLPIRVHCCQCSMRRHSPGL